MTRRSTQNKKHGHSRLIKRRNGTPVPGKHDAIVRSRRPSMKALRAELSADPAAVAARLTLADMFLSRGKAEEAIDLLESPHSPCANELRNDDYWTAARILSFAYAGAARFDDARAIAEEGARALPESLDFHYLLAFVGNKTGDHQLAADHARFYLNAHALMTAEAEGPCYSTASQLHEVCNYLGAALEQAGKTDEAIAAYEQAIAATPSYDVARSNLTRLLKSSGRDSNAETARRQADSACPDSKLLKQQTKEPRGRTRKQTISLCMIVKNEEEYLPRCLASVKPLVDQLIVVDTGSTDRTVEIAESFGASVYHHEWEGNFSKARNISMGYADCDWIVILDADEELNSEDIPTLREAIETTDFNAISVSVYNYSAQKRMYTSFLPSIRAFRRSLGGYYEGIVHNQLRFPTPQGVLRVPVRIDHYGYGLSPEQMARKVRRTKTLLEQQLAENPDNGFAHFNLAQLMRGTDESLTPKVMDEVIFHAGRAVDLSSPDDPHERHIHLMALHQLVTGYFNKGDYVRAAKYAHRALSHKPDYLDAIISLGHIHSMDGQPELAQKYYREYLDRQAAYDEHIEVDHVILLHLRSRHNAQYGLGLTSEMLNDPAEAARWFERCIAERDDYLDAHHRLAAAYLKLDRRDDAVRELQRELELHPENTEARISLADAYVQQDDRRAAMKCLTEGLRENPHDAPVALRLARLAVTAKNWGEALAHCDAIPADDPLSDEAERLRGDALFQTGRYGEAAEVYEKYRARHPDNIDIANNLGNCHFKLGDYAAAELLYREVIDAGKAQPHVYRNLGIALARQEKIDDAIFTLEGYVGLNPDDVESFGFLGDLHYGREDYARAIDEYERVLERQPNRPDTLTRLGDCYLQRGAVSAALLGYERALNVDPDYRPAWARVHDVREYIIARMKDGSIDEVAE
jgi:tetratricopeptide (TPR) repeat protein